MATDGVQPAERLHLQGQAAVAVEGVGRRLRSALRRSLDAAVPPPRRMTSLCQRLGLDKTLASRVNRAASAGSALETLALGPGVPGYRLLVERLKAAVGSAAAPVAELARSVDEMESAYAMFPDGRRGFEAALAGWLPQGRATGERRARQQIYQATLFLMGVEIDVAYQAYLYMPSAEDAAMCDLGFAEVRQDVRRAAPGGRSVLTGVPYVISRQGDVGTARVETLEGRPTGADPRGALMRELCSEVLPTLAVQARGGAMQLVMAGDVPAVGERVTTALGVIGRCMEPRWRRAAGDDGVASPGYVVNSLVLRKPVRLMVVDVLVAEGLSLGEPTVTVSAASDGGKAPTAPGEDDLAALPQVLGFEGLGWVETDGLAGLNAMSSAEVRAVPQVLARVLAAARPRPMRMRAHRLTVEFPMPHARHAVWMELGAGPTDSR